MAKTFDIEIGGRVRTVSVTRRGPDGALTVDLDGTAHLVDAVRVGEASISLLMPGDGGASHDVAVVEKPGNGLLLRLRGTEVEASINGRVKRGADRGGRRVDGPQRLAAPMPGRIVRVLVEPGQTVEIGQGLVIVEAMKMENELRALKAGTVAAVEVATGMSVEAGRLLVVVE